MEASIVETRDTEQPGVFRLIVDPHSGYISATWFVEPFGFDGRGTVEANRVSDDDDWWIARALVQPDKRRGHGIGTRLLLDVLAACKQAGATRVKVTPGGYAEDHGAQRRFYLRNGFVQSPEEEGLLEWQTEKA